jgi:hypothetical protein
MTGTNEHEYRTSDLYYAAFLKASGLTMIRTEKKGPKVQFIFQVDEDLELLKQGWATQEADVNAQAFTHAIRSLKALCFL